MSKKTTTTTIEEDINTIPYIPNYPLTEPQMPWYYIPIITSGNIDSHQTKTDCYSTKNI